MVHEVHEQKIRYLHIYNIHVVVKVKKVHGGKKFDQFL